MLQNQLRRETSLLCASMLLGMMGTSLFLVSLSVQFFSSSSSNLAAVEVYVAQYLPSVALMPLAWRICDTVAIRTVLLRLELVSCGITLLIGALVLAGHPVAALAILILRGFVEMTTKAARNVALRMVTSADEVSTANTWVMGANFTGQAIGAVMGFLLISTGSVAAVTAVAATMFAASAFVCSRLAPQAAVHQGQGTRASLLGTAAAILTADVEKTRALAYLLATTVLLQSFNQVLRVGLPLTWLGLPAQMAAVNEIIGSFGILAGLMLVSRFRGQDRPIAIRDMRSAFLAALMLAVLPFALPRSPPMAFAIYLMFMMLFEVSFMLSMNGLLARSRRDDTPTLMVVFYGAAFGGMSIVTVAQAVAVDRFGFQAVSGTILIGGIVASLMIECVGHYRFRLPSNGSNPLTRPSD